MKPLRKLLTAIFTVVSIIPFSFASPIQASDSAVLSYDCASQSQISTAQCEALKSFYQSTNGDGWKLSNPAKRWFAAGSKPCATAPNDSWEGVFCAPQFNDKLAIEKIDLNSHNLAGTIPDDFFSAGWPYLKILHLYSNSLSGKIPGDLPKSLQEVALNFNHFSGGIPASLGTLTNVTYIDLSSNRLSGNIPGSLATSDWNLHTFLIYDNMLSVDKKDTVLTSWLASVANVAGDWSNSQTIPPANIDISQTSDTSVHITWKSVNYVLRAGYYEVGYRKFLEKDLVYLPVSGDKSSTEFDINNLEPGITYLFTVRTVTLDPAGELNFVSLPTPFMFRRCDDVKSFFIPITVKN